MTCPWNCAVCSLCSLTYTRALSPTVAFTPLKVTLAQLPRGCYYKAHKKKKKKISAELAPHFHQAKYFTLADNSIPNYCCSFISCRPT